MYSSSKTKREISHKKLQHSWIKSYIPAKLGGGSPQNLMNQLTKMSDQLNS